MSCEYSKAIEDAIAAIRRRGEFWRDPQAGIMDELIEVLRDMPRVNQQGDNKCR